MEDIKPSRFVGPPPPRPPKPPGEVGPRPLQRPNEARLAPAANLTAPVPPRPSKPPGEGAPRPTTATPKMSPPVAQPPAQLGVVIRTMQDDLGASRQPTPAGVAAGTPPVPTAPRTFPLPPQPTTGGQKVVMVPAVKRRRRSRALITALIGTLAVVALAAGGVITYLTVFVPAEPTTEEGLIAEPLQVVPSEFTAVLRYRLASEDQADIAAAWSASGTPSVASLLKGDPRLLLAVGGPTQAFYVLLPEEPRPFLVAPRTALTTELLANTPDAQVLEQDGWYIAHPINTESYTTALTAGTLASVGGHPLMPAGAPSEQVTLLFSQSAVSTLRQQVAGSQFAVGQLLELGLTGRFQTPGTLTFTGLADYQTPPTTASTDQQLLSLIPADATTLRVGANFQEDLARWQSVAAVIADETISQPAVRQLLDQLTTPYAYYRRTGADGSADIGLIITLPASLQGTLTPGNPALEQGLAAMLPLILDRRSAAPVSFLDATYNGVPLRYANLARNTQALDYAITGNTLFIASSKEGMFAALDVAAATAASFATAADHQPLFSQWGALPPARDIIIGSLTVPGITQLLPTQSGSVPFGLTIVPTPQGQTRLSGVLLIAPVVAPLSTPASTPSPTPTVP